MKQQEPKKTSQAVDANLRHHLEDGTETPRDNEGNPAVKKEDIHPVSELSNNLSNDISGSTQFVNLDTSKITEDNHEQPDSQNTTDREAPTAETHRENNEPLDKTNEDKTINKDNSELEQE